MSSLLAACRRSTFFRILLFFWKHHLGTNPTLFNLNQLNAFSQYNVIEYWTRLAVNLASSVHPLHFSTQFTH